MAWQELIQQLRAQYASSTMLQYLLPLIPAIVLIYLAVMVFDQVEPLQAEFRQLQQQQTRLLAVQKSADWNSLVEHERQNEQTLRSRIWSAESVELGAADLQAAISALTKDRIDALRVRFAEPLWLPEADAWQLSAEFSGRMAAGQVQPLMAALSGQRPQLRVDRFSYAPQRSGLTTIQVSALLAGPPPGVAQGAEE